MTNDTTFDEKAIAAEMHGIAQMAILEWFADLLRIRLASQSKAQRALTLAILQDGLQDVLTRHETQTYASPVSPINAMKSMHFKQAFGKLSETLMKTMGSGLTDAEKASMA
ncbi:MAG: hypothetical protein JWQ88_1408 [Rhodoferax sp.]|nr:hypothetical protein [Rhodoferax sp.]